MTIAEVLARAVDRMTLTLSEPWEVVAFIAAALASALIIVSTLVKTILPLRWLAVGSNLGFVVYGIVRPALMVLLHAALLPVNLYRAAEMVRLTRRVVGAATSREHSAVWLQAVHEADSPARRRRAVPQGRCRRPPLLPGRGRDRVREDRRHARARPPVRRDRVLAPDRQRTNTARCVTACKVLRIDERTFKQLYYQNPEFGFEVVKLIAARFSDDVRRLEQRLAGSPAASTSPSAATATGPSTTGGTAP